MSERDLNRDVASNLRAARQRRGWSQEEFAARCGLHRTYIGAIERGECNITLRTLQRLAAALGCDIGSLLAPDGAMPT